MSEESKALYDIDCTRINKFSLDGHMCYARVASVYDGDTITAIFKLPSGSEYYKWNCRLYGIDTPELKTGNNKEAALKARDFLREKILDKVVKISCGEFDKYGRLLVHIFCEELDINAIMLSTGHAKPYFGGTKENT
jgi:endonuclease YncB( thermonuclease family)